jgi:hypothetical protein
MPKYRILAKVTQYEHWFVEAESLEAAQNGVFEVDDTEMLDEAAPAEIIETELWGGQDERGEEE